MRYTVAHCKIHPQHLSDVIRKGVLPDQYADMELATLSQVDETKRSALPDTVPLPASGSTTSDECTESTEVRFVALISACPLLFSLVHRIVLRSSLQMPRPPGTTAMSHMPPSSIGSLSALMCQEGNSLHTMERTSPLRHQRVAQVVRSPSIYMIATPPWLILETPAHTYKMNLV